MRLVDLDPRWVKHFSDGPRTGFSFWCPHCGTQRLAIPFTPTMPDGILQALGVAWPNPYVNKGNCWQRVGETFENMTLSPSIDASALGHWHGHITNGEIT